MDERVQAIVDFYSAPPPDPPTRSTAGEVRLRWAATAAILNENAPDRPILRGQVVRERGGHRLTVDVYPPDGAGPHPALCFFHGGAWIAGSPDTHRKLSLRFAEQGYLLFSVNYALAPEQRYPAGLDDCLFAAGWVADHAADFGGDAARLAIAGDSAGANLATAALHRLLARDGRTPFRAAVLPYGVYDFPAMLDLGPEAPFVNGTTFAWQIEDYIGPGAGAQQLRAPGVSPRLSPHLAAFPPALLLVGTQDPLLQQSQDFAAALESSGATAELRTFEAAPHAFLQIEDLPQCRDALAAVWRFLDRYLAGRERGREEGVP